MISNFRSTPANKNLSKNVPNYSKSEKVYEKQMYISLKPANNYNIRSSETCAQSNLLILGFS